MAKAEPGSGTLVGAAALPDCVAEVRRLVDGHRVAEVIVFPRAPDVVPKGPEDKDGIDDGYGCPEDDDGNAASGHGNGNGKPEAKPARGTIDLVGYLRFAESGSMFVADHDAAGTTWFVRDHRAMAKELGWGDVAPFYIDLESPAPATDSDAVFSISAEASTGSTAVNGSPGAMCTSTKQTTPWDVMRSPAAVDGLGPVVVSGRSMPPTGDSGRGRPSFPPWLDGADSRQFAR